VANGQFHIFPVSTVDEGIQVLTGVKAGERKNSIFERFSLNYWVLRELHRLAYTLEAMPLVEEENPDFVPPIKRKNRKSLEEDERRRERE